MLIPIKNAVGQNVLVCFAAGNDNRNIDTTPRYPAVYPEVVSVAATDQHDIHADFSNYGKKVDGNNPEFVGFLGKGRINAYRAIRMTPRPAVKYRLRAKYKFTQKNSGSSSALAFAVRMRIGGWFSPVLMFLTQKPYSERIYYLHPYTGHVLDSIDPVGNDTIGSMEWNGRLILAGNVTTGSGSINFIHPNTGAQLGTLGVPTGRGEGLAVFVVPFRYRVVAQIRSRGYRSEGLPMTCLLQTKAKIESMLYGLNCS